MSLFKLFGSIQAFGTRGRRACYSALGVLAASAVVLADDTPERAPQAEPLYTVLNPIGIAPVIERKPMAERPASLAGKTIFLVDVTFNGGDLFLQQMQEWFRANQPDVKTVFRVKRGAYPTDDPELWKEIQATGGLMVMAIGHCSTCSPAVVAHVAEVESNYDVPAVGVMVDVFKDLVRDKAFEEGMPALRLAFTHTPVGGKTAAELAEYIAGDDPVTKQPLMQEIMGHLTRPLNDDERKTGLIERPKQRLLGPDTADTLQKYFDDRFWTDQLPIVMPTEERVAAMLANTSHDRDEIVGSMRVTGEREAWQYTVETVAINAVMAGAKPVHFPAILALAASQTTARASSTSSMTGMALFNGPIVDELELNSGIGALGLYNNAGALIGRAWSLLSANVTGGSVPGHTYMGMQGNPMGNVPAVFAENVAELPPGWNPLHVQKGFKPDESVVSTFSGCQSQNTMMVLQDEDWEWVLKRFIGGLGPPNRGDKLLLVDPTLTGPFLRFGFDTKEKLIAWVEQNVTTPRQHYWLDQEVINYKLGPARAGREPYATWLKLPDDAPVPYLENVEVVLVGGGGNVRWSVNECGYRRSVRVADWR